MLQPSRPSNTRGQKNRREMAAKAEVRPRPLKVDVIEGRVEMGFGNALHRLKLDVLGTDDSPIPISGKHPLSHCFSPCFG